MKKENTRNQEELVLEDALTQIIFNEKEEQDMVEDDNAEEIDDEDYEVEEDDEGDDEDDDDGGSFDPQEIETYIGMIVVNSKADIPLLVETLSPYFDIQRHQTGCSFDLTLKGVSKAVGIQKLVEALHKDIKDTIAFGDGRNDLEMLETVGTGVAMDNAVPEAKAVADEICPDVNDDGITTWLKERDFI